MDIESPDDCYVNKLTELQVVKKGDLLAELYCPELSKSLDRMDAFSVSISISSRKIEDGRGREVRTMLESVLNHVEDQLKGLREIHQRNLDLFNMGKIEYTVVDQSLVRVSATEIMREKQRLILQQFDRETQDLVDNNANLKSHVEVEIQRAKDLESRLSVKAPFDGKFKPSCDVGVFLKKGRTIGSIEKE